MPPKRNQKKNSANRSSEQPEPAQEAGDEQATQEGDDEQAAQPGVTNPSDDQQTASALTTPARTEGDEQEGPSAPSTASETAGDGQVDPPAPTTTAETTGDGQAEPLIPTTTAETTADGQAEPPAPSTTAETTADEQADPPAPTTTAETTADEQVDSPASITTAETTGDEQERPPTPSTTAETTGDGQAEPPALSTTSETAGDEQVDSPASITTAETTADEQERPPTPSTTAETTGGGQTEPSLSTSDTEENNQLLSSKPPESSSENPDNQSSTPPPVLSSDLENPTSSDNNSPTESQVPPAETNQLGSSNTDGGNDSVNLQQPSDVGTGSRTASTSADDSKDKSSLSLSSQKSGRSPSNLNNNEAPLFSSPQFTSETDNTLGSNSKATDESTTRTEYDTQPDYVNESFANSSTPNQQDENNQNWSPYPRGSPSQSRPFPRDPNLQTELSSGDYQTTTDSTTNRLPPSTRGTSGLVNEDIDVNQPDEKVPFIPQTTTPPRTRVSTESGSKKDTSNKKPSDPNSKFLPASKPLQLLALLSALVLLVSLVQLFIGSLNKNRCPMNPYIPLYLIVAGTLGIILVAFLAALRFLSLKSKGPTRIASFFAYVVLLVYLAWFFVGSVWTYSDKRTVQFVESSYITSYCNSTVYYCAFVTSIILSVVLLGYLLLSCVLRPAPPTAESASTTVEV